MASYPAGVKSWTPVADNVDTIAAVHVNEAYDEIIAIENDLINNSPAMLAAAYAIALGMG